MSDEPIDEPTDELVPVDDAKPVEEPPVEMPPMI